MGTQLMVQQLFAAAQITFYYQASKAECRLRSFYATFVLVAL